MMSVPLNIDWQQILLHMFNFVLLFGILYFLLYKPVKNFMAKRTEIYRQMDEEAKAQVERAEALQQEAEERLTNINKEIAEKRQSADAVLRSEKEKTLKETQAQCEAMLQKAREEAQSFHDDYLHQAQSELEEMITAAAEKMVYPDNDTAFNDFLDAAEEGIENE